MNNKTELPMNGGMRDKEALEAFPHGRERPELEVSKISEGVKE